MTRSSVIAEAALFQSQVEIHKVKREHGLEVAIETAKGRAASMAKFLRKELGSRESYEIYQEISDALATPLLKERSGQ